MSIIHAAAKLIVQAHGDYKFRGRALSWGVPDVYASYKHLQTWFADLPHVECALSTEDTVVSSNKICRSLGYLTGRSFLRSFGFTQIDCLDIPGCEHPAEIEHDLNNPLPETMKGNYEFLLDPGTLEHVFDQRTALENAANSLAVGGVVAHFVPVYSYNGGYFSVNPNVLHDFYGKNGFSDIRAYILMWDRYRAFSDCKTLCYRYDETILGSRHAVADRDQVRYTPHLLFFARKIREVEKFHIPLQFEGDYVGQAAALESARKLSLEQKGKAWSALAFKLLPFDVAFYLQSMAYRELVLRRARHRSGFWI